MSEMRRLIRLLEAQDDSIDLPARYQYWNNRLFDGKLPDIPVLWAALKGVGGVAEAKMKADPYKPTPNRHRVRMGLEDKYSNQVIIPGTMRIRLSSVYHRSPKAIDQMLLHEMIHILMMTTGHLGEGHGRLFEQERLRLSRIVGFEIPRDDNLEKKDLAVEVKIKPYGVVLVKKESGYIYAMLMPQLIAANIAAVRERFDYFVKYKYWQAAYAYIINDQKWSEQAWKTRVQRTPYGPNTNYRTLTDQSAIDDLQQNGKLLVKVEG